MKLLKLISNIIITFLLVFLMIITMFITCSKNFISQKNMSKFIDEANILNTDINILFNKEEIGITLKAKVVSLAIENNIPEKIINDILESKQINDLLGDFFSQTIYYAINGGNKPIILDSTITKMKESARESLEKNINVMISEEDMDKYVENYCNSIVKLVPERHELIGNLPIDIFQDIINVNVIYMYVMIILFLFLVIIINKKWYKFIGFLGLSMAISGIIFVTIGSMDYLVNNLIVNQMTGMQQFISPLITNALTIWFKSGVLVSFSSIILILIYLTLKKINTK